MFIAAVVLLTAAVLWLQLRCSGALVAAAVLWCSGCDYSRRYNRIAAIKSPRQWQERRAAVLSTVAVISKHTPTPEQ